jgi:hypothetical protein
MGDNPAVKECFPLIEVSGSAYELGRQHGSQAAALVRDYLRWIDRLTKVPRWQLGRNALRFLPLIQTLSPKFVDEVHGLADGAGISMEEAMICQTRAESARRWDGGCTAFALTRDATLGGLPLAGQNQDLEPDYAEVAIILKVRPDDGRPAAAMFTFAGQLGYSGINAHGVAQFTNALYNFEWRPGLPHYPLKRVMLEKRSVGECVTLLEKHRACSAANLVLADGAGDIGDVEVRPDGVEVFRGDRPNERLHTNHYLTPRFAPHENGFLPDSAPRLARIRKLVRESWGRITVETMKTILADHQGAPGAICRHGDHGMYSISGYIAEPAKKRLHVRRGNGCDGVWTAYTV